MPDDDDEQQARRINDMRYRLYDSANLARARHEARSDKYVDEAVTGRAPASSPRYKRLMQKAKDEYQTGQSYVRAGERINKSAGRRKAQRDEKRTR